MRLGPEAAEQFRLFVRIMQTVLGALILGLLFGTLLNKTLGLSMSWSGVLMFLGLGFGIYSIYITEKRRKK